MANIVRRFPRSVRPNSGVKGLDKVLSNLNKEIKNITNSTVRGLVLGAALIRRDTEQTEPLTPVDLGNLRASWFTVTAEGTKAGSNPTFKGTDENKFGTQHAEAVTEAQSIVQAQEASGKQKFVIAGYSANYAMYVHENLGANFKRPGAGPKWLEASIKRNKAKIIEIVKNTAKIPK
jgi:hypothetical protein